MFRTWLPILCCCSAVACTSLLGSTGAPGTTASEQSPSSNSQPASTGDMKDMAFTETFAATYAGKVSGYVVKVLSVPEGMDDNRPYPAETWLVQDKKLRTIGFITPGGDAYLFVNSNTSKALRSFGTRKSKIGLILGLPGVPQLRTAAPGAGS